VRERGREGGRVRERERQEDRGGTERERGLEPQSLPILSNKIPFEREEGRERGSGGRERGGAAIAEP
jgi:hypothetical protein